MGLRAKNVIRAKNWTVGRNITVAEVSCCPACGSLDVHHKGTPGDGRSLVFWKCCECGVRWKSERGSGGRAVLVR